MTPDGMRNSKAFKVATEALINKVGLLQQQRDEALYAADKYKQQAKEAQLALSVLASNPKEAKPFNLNSFFWGTGVGALTLGAVSLGAVLLLGEK